MILRTLFSHYRRHPLQGLFLLTGIVVANALLVGTEVINAQARASYDEGERLLGGQPPAEIRPRSDSVPMDEREYIRLRRLGFDRVTPVLRRTVRSDSGEALELLGIDPFSAPGAPGHQSGSQSAGHASGILDSGNRFEFTFPPFRTWVAPSRREQLGWAEGEQIRLQNGQSLPPVQSVPNEGLGHRLLIDIGVLQELTDSRGQLSYLSVFEMPPHRREQLVAALPEHLRYVDAFESPDPRELTRSFHLNLAAMGLLAFVVGLFLVFNALSFSYTDRNELIRRLRLSGVGRRELRGALLLELLIFLGVGGLLGGWLGLSLAAWLLPGVGRTLAQLYDVYIAYPDALVAPGAWLPLAMTALAAVLCVLWPMREVLNSPLLKRGQGGWLRAAVLRRDRGLLLLALVLLFGSFCISRIAVDLWLALAGMAFLLLGAALMLPTVLRLLLGILAHCTPKRRARLAWLLADSRWLLGPASLALMAMTLALVANSGLNTMIGSFRQATDQWLDQRLVASLYVRAEVPRENLQRWLDDKFHGLGAVERFRTSLRAHAPGGGRSLVEVVSLQQGERFEASVEVLYPASDAQTRFRDGVGIYVSERAWRIEGWQAGDAVELCEGHDSVPILGAYRDYGNPRPQWMLSHELFRRCWPDLDRVSLAVLGPPATNWDRVRSELAHRFKLVDSDIIDAGEIKQTGLAVFDRTFTVTRALNSLTLLVAGIGIFCAISAIHHHRVGQQALLSALGVSRRERGLLLLAQWGLIGLLCMVLVWPFGSLLALYLSSVVTPVAFGWSFPLQLDWTHYPALALAAVTALVLAVLLPSWRLLRASPASLLREMLR